MGPPRSPSLPSAPFDRSFAGGPGGNRTLISWVQATDPPVERRAHPGEDNGTRTRTPALTTRRLSLRLCPPQDGPSGGRWSARGDSNPDLHGLGVPRLPVAPRADDVVTTGGFEPPLDRLSTCCLCQLGHVGGLVPRLGFEPRTSGVCDQRLCRSLGQRGNLKIFLRSINDQFRQTTSLRSAVLRDRKSRNAKSPRSSTLGGSSAKPFVVRKPTRRSPWRQPAEGAR